MEKFSPGVERKLKHYVYRLIDPRDGSVWKSADPFTRRFAKHGKSMETRRRGRTTSWR